MESLRSPDFYPVRNSTPQYYLTPINQLFNSNQQIKIMTLPTPKKAIVTLPSGQKVPVNILGFDGYQYKVAADLGDSNWFDKSQVQVIK